MEKTGKQILKTILAGLAMLLFYFIAGAIVVTQKIEGSKAYFIQGSVIWFSVLIPILICLIKNHSLKFLGYKKVKSGASKILLFFIPLILISICSFAGKIDFSEGWKKIVSALFITLAVGFSEETYCRGIICNLWKENSSFSAILISSIVFGLCHLLNILGGAGVVATILQVFFAFFYGIVMAIIFIQTESIFPCIFLHFFHDFCAFITLDLSLKGEIIVGAIQTVIIVAYGLILIIRLKKSVSTVIK